MGRPPSGGTQKVSTRILIRPHLRGRWLRRISITFIAHNWAGSRPGVRSQGYSLTSGHPRVQSKFFCLKTGGSVGGGYLACPVFPTSLSFPFLFHRSVSSTSNPLSLQQRYLLLKRAPRPLSVINKSPIALKSCKKAYDYSWIPQLFQRETRARGICFRTDSKLHSFVSTGRDQWLDTRLAKQVPQEVPSRSSDPFPGLLKTGLILGRAGEQSVARGVTP